MSAAIPGVSILLPVYFPSLSMEALQLLRRALESVLDQDYAGSLEIVLVDDGSPTPLHSVADELGAASSAVRWVRLARNAGIVSALNAGIGAARQPLIARLEADDRWLPGKLEAQVLQFLADPDLSITATGMARVRPDGVPIDTHVRPGDWTSILRFFVEGGCPFPHGSVMARREVYHLLGGYPHDATVQHCEDYALWGTWLRFFKPAMVEAVLYEYRVSGTPLSALHAAQQQAASQIVRRRFADLDLAEVLPWALPELAEALGAPLHAAGRLAYALWQHPGAAFSLPETALKPLAAMLPDRTLEPVDTAPRGGWRLGCRRAPRPSRVGSLRSLSAESITVPSVPTTVRHLPPGV